MSPSIRSIGREPAVMCRSEAPRSIISSSRTRRLTGWGAAGAVGAAAGVGEVILGRKTEDGRRKVQASAYRSWRAFVEALQLDEALAAALVDTERVDEAIAGLASTRPGVARYVHACTRMTVAPTMISVGEKANTIPSSGSLTLDMRLLPGQGTEVAERHLDEVLGDLRGGLGETIHQNVSGSASPADGRLWRALLSSYGSLTGTTVVAPTMAPASTDGRFFRRLGVNAYGAGWFADGTDFGEFLDMFHGHDERIAVESLERTVEFLSAVVTAYADVS